MELITDSKWYAIDPHGKWCDTIDWYRFHMQRKLIKIDTFCNRNPWLIQ